MDIKNIRMTIATVVAIVINTGVLVWGASAIVAKVNSGNETSLRTEKKLNEMESDNKLWKSKMETDLSDLRVRISILESKVKDMELKNFGR